MCPEPYSEGSSHAVQERSRVILAPAANGGEECPSHCELKQESPCKWGLLRDSDGESSPPYRIHSNADAIHSSGLAILSAGVAQATRPLLEGHLGSG